MSSRPDDDPSIERSRKTREGGVGPGGHARSLFLVFDREGQPVGGEAMTPFENEALRTGRLGYAKAVHLLPHLRRQGMGRSAMRAAEERCERAPECAREAATDERRESVESDLGRRPGQGRVLVDERQVVQGRDVIEDPA